MQVNNTDFITSAGGNAASPAERPGDGLFDALLRAEEARYEEARYEEAHARSDDGDDGHRREAQSTDRRPPDDDHFDDYRAEEYREDDHRDDWDDDTRTAGEQPETSDDGDETALESRYRSDDGSDDEPAGTGPDAARSEVDADREGSGAADSTDDREPAATSAANATASQSPDAVTASGLAAAGPSAARVAAVADGAPAQSGSPAPKTQAAAGSAPAAVTADPGHRSTATANPAAMDSSKTQATAEAAAATAAAAKPGANEKATDNAQRTPNPGAATQASATPSSDRNTGSRPGAANPQVTRDDLLVTTSQAGLTSRPAASLAGAAATAAMAEQSRPAGTAANGADRSKAKSGLATAAPMNGQQSAAVSQNKATKVADPSASGVKNDRSFITAGATSSMTAESLGPVNGGGQAQPAITPGSTPGAGSVQNASFTDALANARNSGAPAPAEQIAVQVQKAQQAGKDQLNIKLHPAELGRIEVKLESGDDGVLRAVISAERSETLDLLQRDSRGLERALQDAGVKTDSGSLSFNLKGQQQQAEQQTPGTRSAGARDGAEAEANDQAAAGPLPQHLASHDGALDIRV